MTTDTIKAIQKQIIVKLEAGEDVSELTKRLAQERAKIAAQAEIEQLKKIADERQALRDKAEAVKVKVQKQGEAIDAFLKARDTLVSQLQPLIEPMSELAKMAAAGWEREPGACYSGFGDIPQFAAAVKGISEGYLPADFGCPFLEMAGGQVDALGKAGEAYSYFTSALGILSSLQKGISTMGQLLRQGKPLRDIEAEFDVSRSSLSRHKNHCLNLGAVRIHD